MIPDRVQALLAPQERFDALRARLGPLAARVTDLSYANVDGPLDPAVREVLERALATDRSLAFQYTPFGGSRTARHAVADSLADDATWRDVVLTTGAASALSMVLRAVARPGGEVIVPMPCWLDHPLYVAAHGMRPVFVPLDPATGFGIDVTTVRRALSLDTVAVVLANPGNPTGRNLDGAAVAAALAGTDVTLVADETHRDLAGPGFSSAAAHHDRTVIVYSFGKYHGIQGQRLGYAAVSPRHPRREALADELVRWSRIAGNTTPTSLMQLATPDLLRLRHDTTELDRWRERYLTELGRAGYASVRPDGTYFLYVRTPTGIADEPWVETLAREHKVLASPAPLFHHTGYFRLSLTATADRLDRALGALVGAADRWCHASV